MIVGDKIDCVVFVDRRKCALPSPTDRVGEMEKAGLVRQSNSIDNDSEKFYGWNTSSG